MDFTSLNQAGSDRLQREPEAQGVQLFARADDNPILVDQHD
jgi:hypothetical protein